jgi:hypothetical protein
MIPVYEDGRVVARVKYNNNLDFWDGHNWTNGSTGHHNGLTRLKNGDYVLIHGSQWQGERDTAEIISRDEALQLVLDANDDDLWERFPELSKMRETELIEEE